MSSSLNKNLLALFFLAPLAVLVTLIPGLSPNPPRTAAAQTPSADWSDPINLSNSGGATDPFIVADSTGTIHIGWLDVIEGFQYSEFDGLQWTPGQRVRFPFEPDVPQFVAGPDDRIHAFWIDDRDQLRYSWVESESFGVANRWSNLRVLANSALGVDVDIDLQGNLHLIYLDPVEIEGFPAGVYYLKSTNNGLNWSRAAELYASPYFRTLTKADINLDLDTTAFEDSTAVHAVWDNRPRNRVLTRRSTDGGETWGELREIFSSEAGFGQRIPFNIRIYSQEQSQVLSWQEGQPGGDCTNFFQVSDDYGETWHGVRRYFDLTSGCPQDFRIFLREGDFDILLATVQNQVFLSAWDGTSWSLPQSQQKLSSFIDQESNGAVNLSCVSGTLIDGRRLVVVGCDASGNGDIWLLQRDIADAGLWYPPPSAWALPQLVTAVSEQTAPISLVSDPEGRLHALWREHDLSDPSNPTTLAVYSRFEADMWSPPVTIDKSTGSGTGPIAAVIDPRGRLLTAWSGGLSGEIFFSKADFGRATAPGEWSDPAQLPSPLPGGSTPDMVFDGDSTLYLIYALPLNEGRGVYLTKSIDAGDSWLEPILVFDGAAAGWERVGPPALAQHSGGVLHAVWAQQSLPGGPGPQALYYARSGDGGESWSTAERVAEEPVVWSDVVATDGGAVHRLWQVTTTSSTVIWHQFSPDGGLTWSQPSTISSFGGARSPLGLAPDPSGGVHFFQFTQELAGQQLLRSWGWDGERWKADENLVIETGSSDEPLSLAGAYQPPGILATIYNLKTVSLSGDAVQNNIFFTQRELGITPATQTPGSSLTPAATLSDPATPTPGITPSPTVSFAEIGGGPSGSPLLTSDNAWIGAVAGVAAAGLIIAAIVIGLRFANRGRNF